MASTINIGTVDLANTFNEWRIQTNLAVNDANEIARGDFVKPTGNVTLNLAKLTLANTVGTTLVVDADARVSGVLSVKNFQQDGGNSYLYTGTSDAQFTNAQGTLIVVGNTRTRFLYNNNYISAANINAAGYIETTGAQANNGLIVNVAGFLTVDSGSSTGNVNVSTGLTVSSNTTTGNLTVVSLANIAQGNIVVANVTTMNVRAPGAQAWIANATIANSVTANASIGFLDVTTRANAVLANIITANILTMNANTSGASVVARNLTASNISTGNIVMAAGSVTANLFVGGTLNVANILINNTISGNVRTGTLNVTSLINAVSANIGTLSVTSLSVTDPISAPSESDSSSYRLRVSQTTDGDGSFGVKQGTGHGNALITYSSTNGAWRLTPNSEIVSTNGYSTILTAANIKSLLSTSDSANAASLTAVRGANDNAVSALVSSNTAANTVRVSANSAGTLTKVQLNFVNSASINVAISAGGGGATGNANITFTANSSNPALLGPQGATGAQGLAGLSGSQGATGNTGSQGATGSQGLLGAQGLAGFNGSQGLTGNTGAQGAIGTGTQGLTGNTGPQGAAGPSTTINATATSDNDTCYPVYVTSLGSNAPAEGSSGYTFNPSTKVVSATDFSATSDAKFKDVIGKVDQAILKIEQLRGVEFKWNQLAKDEKISTDERLQVGLIAQEIEKLYPSLVDTSENGNKSVSYGRVVAILIEAVKELHARVAILEGK